MSKENKLIEYGTMWPANIGAIAWGLVGFFSFNLVAALFGSIAKWIYVAIGVLNLIGLAYLIKSGEDMELWEWLLIGLISVGNIVWLLVGLFNFNPVTMLLGTAAMFVYMAVGIAGAISIVLSIVNRD